MTVLEKQHFNSLVASLMMKIRYSDFVSEKSNIFRFRVKLLDNSTAKDQCTLVNRQLIKIQCF